MASAENQRKVMNMIQGRAMASAANLAKIGEKIDKQFVFGLLSTFSENDIQSFESLLLKQCFVAGTDSPVTIRDFQGKIYSYYLLIAEAIVFNLADFFTWLDAENSAANPTPSKKKAR